MLIKTCKQQPSSPYSMYPLLAEGMACIKLWSAVMNITGIVCNTKSTVCPTCVLHNGWTERTMSVFTANEFIPLFMPGIDWMWHAVKYQIYCVPVSAVVSQVVLWAFKCLFVHIVEIPIQSTANIVVSQKPWLSWRNVTLRITRLIWIISKDSFAF